MEKIKCLLKNKKFQLISFCFIVSFVLLLVLSRNSFLYGFNDWEDANAFFTLGKSLFNGKIIYKEIFEQKGPYLYLIYGIGYLLSNKTFLGVFFLEVISSTVFLYYVHKVIDLYLDRKYSYIIIPMLAAILYGSSAFRQGGSCEEFAFPMMMITIYNLLKYNRDKDISYKTVYITGFLAGLIFLMKYTLLGINFGFMVYLFFSLISKKQIKKAFLSAFIYLGGMFTPIIPWIIYFLVNGALYDFINVYILINLFSYTKESISIISKLITCFKLGYENLLDIGIYIIVLIGLSLFGIIFHKKDIKDKLALLCLFIFTVIFIYIGGIYFKYYGFPILLFILFGFIYLFIIVSDKKIDIPNFVFVALILAVSVISYFTSPNTRFIGKPKDEYVVYKFSDIIMKEENPTILNYGWLDCGFYTTTGITPNIKYFEKQNFDYKKFRENMDEQNSYIENKQVQFVVTAIRDDRDYPITDYLEINYEKISEEKVDYDYAINTFALYKLK